MYALIVKYIIIITYKITLCYNDKGIENYKEILNNEKFKYKNFNFLWD